MNSKLYQIDHSYTVSPEFWFLPLKKRNFWITVVVLINRCFFLLLFPAKLSWLRLCPSINYFKPMVANLHTISPWRLSFFPSGDSKSDCLKFIFSKNKNGLINLAICCFVSEEAFALRFRYRFQYCSQFQRLEVKMGWLYLKGSVSRDFRPQVFFMIRTHLGPW